MILSLSTMESLQSTNGKLVGLGWWFGFLGSPYERDCYLGTRNHQFTISKSASPKLSKICKHPWICEIEILFNNGLTTGKTKKTLKKNHGLDMSSIPGEWIQKFPPVKLRVSYHFTGRKAQRPNSRQPSCGAATWTFLYKARTPSLDPWTKNAT